MLKEGSSRCSNKVPEPAEVIFDRSATRRNDFYIKNASFFTNIFFRSTWKNFGAFRKSKFSKISLDDDDNDDDVPEVATWVFSQLHLGLLGALETRFL